MAKSKKPKRTGPAVARIRLTETNALRIVRRLAQNSGAVQFTNHASIRMRQRRITRVQVLECLLKGIVCEGPALDIKHCWNLKLRRVVCGDEVQVVVALQWDFEAADYLIVVTVIGN